MALGYKASVANAINDALLRAGSFSGPANLYTQLHTAAPGASGTTSVGNSGTRKVTAFAASSAGVSATSGALTWTSVSDTTTYTHFTIFDASSAGNFQLSGTVTANAVTTGDTFTIASGGLTWTLNVAT